MNEQYESFEEKKQRQIKELSDRKHEDWIKSTSLKASIDLFAALPDSEKESLLKGSMGGSIEIVMQFVETFEKYLKK